MSPRRDTCRATCASLRVDVSFKAPDRTWSAGVNRPTLNLFLYDVHKDARFSTSGRHQGFRLPKEKTLVSRG